MNEAELDGAPHVSSLGQWGDLCEGESKNRRGAKAKLDLPQDVAPTCPAVTEAEMNHADLHQTVSFSKHLFSRPSRGAYWVKVLAPS